MSTRQNSSAGAAHALACSFLSGPLSVPLFTMLAYSVCAAKKKVDIFKNADIKWKTACPWGEQQVQNIARCEKKIQLGTYRKQLPDSGRQCGWNGVGKWGQPFDERRDVSRSRRGLDNCWWSDSSTLTAIAVESIGPNAQSSLRATYMLSRKPLVGIYLCSGS